MYSTQNQAAAIAIYAARHNLTIVRTYKDEGLSGLTIQKREGLKQLIADVRSGGADFSRVLVYDVSRWGRFQDVDESAHYEFICRRAGIAVEYCAEQFENDGSLLSSIVKNLKRVMAAEYSRELSVKIHTGQSHLAALGFHQGSTPGYGLRRELIDENRLSKGYLRRGERKCLKADRVILRLGPPAELKVIRRIFHQYVEDGKTMEEIARQLKGEGVPPPCAAQSWNRVIIKCILKNENYIGNGIYNRVSVPLKARRRANPPGEWIRSEGILAPFVDSMLFHRAQRLIALRYLHLHDDEMLSRLKSLLEKKGRLTRIIIDSAAGVPSACCYDKRFGSLRNAYKLVGYQPTRDLDWVDRKEAIKTLQVGLATDTIAGLERAGASTEYNQRAGILTVNGRLALSVRIATCANFNGVPTWTIFRRVVLPDGLILAGRLDESNHHVIEYFLLPTTEMKKTTIRFTAAGSRRFEAYRFETVEAVVRSISVCVGKPGKRICAGRTASC
jgi:DNA invertase Pin-like site-specific DNA recombinase